MTEKPAAGSPPPTTLFGALRARWVGLGENLQQRILVAVVAVPALLLAFLGLPYIFGTFVIAIACAMCLREWFHAILPDDPVKPVHLHRLHARPASAFRRKWALSRFTTALSRAVPPKEGRKNPCRFCMHRNMGYLAGALVFAAVGFGPLAGALPGPDSGLWPEGGWAEMIPLTPLKTPWLGPAFCGIGAAVFGLLVFHLFFHLELEGTLDRLAKSIFGVLYVGIGFGVLLLMFFLQGDGTWNGRGLLLMTLAVTWLNDTGGYFAGRTFGKTPLWPTISPKKTVEGFIGGLAAAVVTAWIFGWAIGIWPKSGWGPLATLGLFAGLLGSLGDLAESMLKRSIGTKDIAHSLPGHGGMLDRLDGVIFTAPMFLIYGLHSLNGRI